MRNYEIFSKTFEFPIIAILQKILGQVGATLSS